MLLHSKFYCNHNFILLQLTEQFRTQVTEKLEVVKQTSVDDAAIQQQMDKVNIHVSFILYSVAKFGEIFDVRTQK